ncbi:MAG: PIG-L deacetylase family protein [Crocinitomicaceae bacterium]|nr:PIG-L deacetylase family protein [Crocinitomicaceae bacterium]
MLLSSINKVLILAPHPDDAEFGLGGTIAKLTEMGKEIHIAVFSMCEKSTPEGFEIGAIEDELYKSCEFLEIKKENLHIMDFPVRDFPALRQDILEKLIVLRNTIKPEMVFLPSSSDIHQDHKTIHEEGIRAFKYCSLMGYEMPWNNFGFTSYVYIKLEKEHIDKKIGALNFYDTQKHRSYSTVEFVASLAKLRGIQIQEEFAESFEMIRFIQK